MLKKIMLNLKHPRGFMGSLILSAMNIGHKKISNWGLSHLAVRPGDHILDIGCGGGENIKRLAKLAKEGSVCGLDYSAVSVQKSSKVNHAAIAAGRVEIKEGDAARIPWPDSSFDTVTAFETIYFWPDFSGALLDIWRILKPGGVFLICNEAYKKENGEVPFKYFVTTLDMAVYSQTELEDFLTGAGFVNTTIHIDGKNTDRLCSLAQKPA